MAAGEQIPQCDACWHNERRGQQSFRTTHSSRWLGNNPALRAAIDAATDWAAPTDPLYVDLRLGNICNLKCTICKPLYSSQIERDPAHARWNTDAPYNRFPSRFSGADDWSEAPALLDEVMDISGRIELLQLAGGEPTINRMQLAWLKRLCDEDRAQSIDLDLSTNLSNATPVFLNMLRQFKSVAVCASIDGQGATYEYVRYPAKWSSLTRNVDRLRAARPDVDLRVVCVLQALNLGNLADLIAWAASERLPFRVWIGRGLERYNDVRILPLSYRRAARRRIDDAVAQASNEPELHANVRQVFDEIDAEDFGEDRRREAAAGFMQFVNDMDRSRGLSFRAVAPDVHAAVATYSGSWDERGRYSALVG